MAYMKPKCTCGKDLQYAGKAYVILDVKRDGRISRYDPYISPTDDGVRLWCRVCDKNYELIIDSKERIFRGNRISRY